MNIGLPNYFRSDDGGSNFVQIENWRSISEQSADVIESYLNTKKRTLIRNFTARLKKLAWKIVMALLSASFLTVILFFIFGIDKHEIMQKLCAKNRDVCNWVSNGSAAEPEELADWARVQKSADPEKLRKFIRNYGEKSEFFSAVSVRLSQCTFRQEWIPGVPVRLRADHPRLFDCVAGNISAAEFKKVALPFAKKACRNLEAGGMLLKSNARVEIVDQMPTYVCIGITLSNPVERCPTN